MLLCKFSINVLSSDCLLDLRLKHSELNRSSLRQKRGEASCPLCSKSVPSLASRYELVHWPHPYPVPGDSCCLTVGQRPNGPGQSVSSPALRGCLLGTGWKSDMMDALTATFPVGHISNFPACRLKALLQSGTRGMDWLLFQGHRDCH